MGNTLGGKKTAKVMKINGETFKFKTPVKAGDVVKDYPGHVLLESEAVKHYGIRAKPLEAHQDLVPKRLYFLVELPETPTERVPRRVRSGINMSAKDRLESLMLSRRSTSDLSIMKPSSIVSEEAKRGAMRVKMRLPKEQVEKLMQESKGLRRLLRFWIFAWQTLQVVAIIALVKLHKMVKRVGCRNKFIGRVAATGESATKGSSRHVRYVHFDINPDFVACSPVFAFSFFYIYIHTPHFDINPDFVACSQVFGSCHVV
jgi:hypothetical protein